MKKNHVLFIYGMYTRSRFISNIQKMPDRYIARSFFLVTPIHYMSY